MVDVLIVVASLAISTLGGICVPICIKNARNDVIENIIIVDERPLHLQEVDFTGDLTDKDMDSSK